MDYYTRYIQANPDWELVEVYAEMLTPTLIQLHTPCTQTAPRLHPKCTQSRKLGAFVAFSESF